MLTVEHLSRVKLSARPAAQLLVAETFLRFNYAVSGVRIVVEGAENIPQGDGVFFAMNHTDRYNYWPFQYTLYRRRLGFTATWVKGKYYQNPWMARFMNATNGIPLPSRGYLVTGLFKRFVGRLPSDDEYRAFKGLIEGRHESDDMVAPLLSTAGLTVSDMREAFDTNVAALMQQVTRLNEEALKLGCHVLVFPQGTRSIRLSKGHTGLAQMTQYLGRTIVPVGCSGSDKVHPGNSPWAKGGTVIYRIGKPLAVDGDALSPHRVGDPFVPLSSEAAQHDANFRAITDIVMERINDLVDDDYRWAEAGASDGVRGVSRFA